ncbi:ankyrin [Thozetella sp. PMI_491]|nr:ankyrin [Thozetella sp. PMI_491]
MSSYSSSQNHSSQSEGNATAEISGDYPEPPLSSWRVGTLLDDIESLEETPRTSGHAEAYPIQRTLPDLPGDAGIDPPPPYEASSPTTSFPQPSPAQSSTQLPQSSSPPPQYRPRPGPPAPQPSKSTAGPLPRRHAAPAPARSAEAELQVLAGIFDKHPWRRIWGPRPKTLAGALKQAALIGTTPHVLALLETGAPIEQNEHSATQNTTAIHEALRGPKPELVLTLLEHASNTSEGRHNSASFLASRDEKGCTPLHVAAEVGEALLVLELVRRGAVVDAVDKHSRTPLHMAARYGREQAMHCLLACGADPSKIHEGLWIRAGATTTEELGSYSLVSGALKKVMEQRRVQDGKAAESEQQTRRERQATTTLEELVQGESSNAVNGQLSSLERPSIPDYRLSRSIGSGQRSDMSDATFNSMFDATLRPRRRLSLSGNRSHAAPSFLGTHEYFEWSRYGDRIYAEYLAQMERNRDKDDGGMGFDPAGL